MIRAVESYVAVRRAGGFDFKDTEGTLRSFARFAAIHGEAYVRTATAIDWANQGVSVGQRDKRLKVVCRFARFMHAEDVRHELPPPNHFGYHKTRRPPYIYSPDEISRLMDAALHIGMPGSLEPQAYATLIGLLAATGLRIREALSLLFSDVTPSGLLIRKAKFQKTRLAPLHESTAAAMERYLALRRGVHTHRESIFITNDGRPLLYHTVRRNFRKMLAKAEISPARGRFPRIHDLRHTFAVRALERCPEGRQRVGQHMLALATYMGHVNITSTYWYLETTPELLRDIATAGELHLCGGRP
jgi:integrase/recombinase XerD